MPIHQEAKSYSQHLSEISYNLPMDKVRKNLTDAVADKGANLAELSRALGRNHAYLQQFVRRGVPADLPEKVRLKLALLLGVDERTLRNPDAELDSMDVAAMSGTAGDDGASRVVPIVGYIGAGAEVFPLDDHEKGAGLDYVKVPFPVRPGTVCAIVRGDSQLPMFEDGDLIGFVQRGEDPTNLIGKRSVVKLMDGRILIKRLRRGSEAGLYTLVSSNARDIEDVEIEWAAQYSFSLPADEWHSMQPTSDE